MVPIEVPILLLLLLALSAVFYYVLRSQKKTYSYWKDRGVAQFNPSFIYGDMKEVVLRKKSTGVKYVEFYYEFKKMGAQCGGLYRFSFPVLMLLDIKLIKLVLFKDFEHFSAHSPKFSDALFFNNMFHMDGQAWRNIRKKLTPTFTSGKMKMMFDTMAQKTKGLTDLVGDMIKTGKNTEFKELLARYTTDVIGSCAFGIECDSINDINSEFFQKGQEVFTKLIPKASPNLFIIFLITTGLIRTFKFDLADVEDFFRKVVYDTVKYREENKIVRKDFLHLMIQLKNKGSMADIGNEKEVFQKNEGEEGLSLEELVGQCLLFFTAGFETSSTTMSFAFLELTQNQDVQDKLRQEIREVLKKYNGNLTYDALQEMTYLENVIMETLRKYPPLPILPRMCTKTYLIPNTEIVIEKGRMVDIPLLAIQNDPEYFPHPEKFDPERFNEENKHKIADCTFMPFGDGPRQCLGLRFGMMQSKAGIASLINRYKFTLNKKTPYPPIFSGKTHMLSTEGGIWLDATEVE